MRKKKPKVIVIKRSCLTGEAVWVYRGPSREAARRAYWRACKREIQRVKDWGRTAAERVAAIRKLATDCTSRLAGKVLTPAQEEAIRQLKTIEKKLPEYHCAFYDHIMEERRRRKADSKIRQKMRERENRNNRNYDK